jgi:hypothetical protein
MHDKITPNQKSNSKSHFETDCEFGAPDGRAKFAIGSHASSP